jgi:GWxTD domain-containing protein
MSYQKLIRRLALVLATLALAAPLAWAQKDKKSQQQQQDPQDKPRNIKPELKRAYKDWLEKDVPYIITDEERKAFKKLATDEEREQFIEQFWRRRDPDPDTEENEYRELYYERIAYANEHFTSGRPGWMTDRGRIYIKFGKADEVESHPNGGLYDRPAYHGGGSTTTYPFEIWFYRYLPGVGSGIEIEFVDPTGSGEFRIARSPNEKDALAWIPGAGQTDAERFGLVDQSARQNDFLGSTTSSRWQDQPFERLAIMRDLDRPPQVKFSDLESISSTGSPKVEENPLSFDMRVDFFRQSEDRVLTAFTIQAENKDLVFQDVGGVQEARLNIFGRITSLAGRRAGIFEDPVTTRATTEELTDMKDRKSAYQKAVPLAPGTYKVDVVVRDVVSGATGVRHLGFTVPKYVAEKLATSTLILAARLQSLGGLPPAGMFTIGEFKVIPNVSANYRQGDPLGLYLQVYNAGIDQTTLRPSVDVDYVILKDSKEVGKQAEDWKGMSDSGQRLTLARLLRTDQLMPGEYKLEIRIRDRVSGQTLAPSATFTITK